MRPKVILFDLDDTLVVDEAAVMDSLRAVCAGASRRIGVETERLHHAVLLHARHLWRSSPTFAYCHAMGIGSWEGLCASFVGEGAGLANLREWAPTFRRSAWQGALAEVGARDARCAEELAENFIHERATRYRPFPEALVTLAALRRDLALGIVTNGVPDLQWGKIERAGLTPYFDVVTVSAQVGFGKPDPRVFAVSLAQLGALPGEVVMVGDSLERDVAGARNAGIAAIWLNRAGREESPGGARPDLQIRSLQQMEHAISELP